METKRVNDLQSSIERLNALSILVSASDVPDTMLSLLTALRAFLATLPADALSEEELLVIEEMRKL